ncbi:hypothetical protein LEP1GSC192_0195 [Leptospira sp. B5-022]|nr:hypothetical protein LEP1GSC192_0195 [Leptospira sp. B5-022]
MVPRTHRTKSDFFPIDFCPKICRSSNKQIYVYFLALLLRLNSERNHPSLSG